MEAPSPDSVSIIAMGRSLFDYLVAFERRYKRPTQHVWAINSAGVWLNDLDAIFAMDNFRRDMRIDDGKHRQYVSNLIHRGKRIISDVQDPDWPHVEAYPLSEVARNIWPHATTWDQCFPWFQNTIHYAIAYALWKGMKEIWLYGCEFCFSDDPYKIAAEAVDHNDKPYWWVYHMPSVVKHRRMGEPGLETTCWLLGIAHQRGVDVRIPNTSTLMNADRTPYWYGYDLHPEVDLGYRSRFSEALRD